jgi:hypothetical protein
LETIVIAHHRLAGYVAPNLRKEKPMNENRTTITDIDIPFGRMVMILLKTMLAAIPAMLLFYLVMIPVLLLFGLGLGGCAALFSLPFSCQ